METRTPLVIKASRGWRSIDLREIWNYRELLHIFAWRDLKVRYRQTLLGVLWIAGQPLVSMIIFTLLFNRLARFTADGGAPYPVFVFAGLLIWNLVANTIVKAGNSLIGASYLISKVYFPRMVIPLSSVVSEIVDFCVAGIMLVLLMIRYRVNPGASILLLPLPIAVACLLALGVGLWVAALNVEFRDVRVLVPFVLQLGIYAAPIVYPFSAIPEKYRWLAMLNPMTGIVLTFRAAVLGLPIPSTALVWSALFAIACAATGAYYFRRMERLFADVL